MFWQFLIVDLLPKFRNVNTKLHKICSVVQKILAMVIQFCQEKIQRCDNFFYWYQIKMKASLGKAFSDYFV
jgi:hypothetical protein